MSLFRRLAHIWIGSFRRLPATMMLVLTASALFAARIAVSLFDPAIDANHYYPGALNPLENVRHPEIHGFLELWNGQWWRILVSSFHHGGVLHLTMNAIGLWYFGELLERRIGWIRFLAFSLLAGLITMLPELFLGFGVIGLSGVVFAQFGLALVLRNRNERLREEFSDRACMTGFFFLFACLPLAILGLEAIANGAHFVGVIYGAVTGWLCFELWPRRRAVAAVLITTLHVVVGFAVALLMHPVWNGRYYAWQALEADGPEELRLWQRAIELEPQIPLGWRAQAVHEAEQGDLLSAWRTVLRGARFNRNSELLSKLAQAIWFELPDERSRETALLELERIFPGEAQAWRRRLQIGDPFNPDQLADGSFLVDEDEPEPTLDVDIELPDQVPGLTTFRGAPAAVEVDPHDPDSARLGDRL